MAGDSLATQQHGGGSARLAAGGCEGMTAMRRLGDFGNFGQDFDDSFKRAQSGMALIACGNFVLVAAGLCLAGFAAWAVAKHFGVL